MAINCLVNLIDNSAAMIGSLARVEFPDGSVAFAVLPGHVHPPQYVGESNLPPAFKVLTAVIVTQGTGTVASDSPPVYDPLTDTVTVTRTLSAPLKQTVISYEAFQDRFTAVEFKALTAFVVQKAADGTKPEYLQAILMRKSVNLLGSATITFMDALVVAGVLTQARRDAILTP